MMWKIETSGGLGQRWSTLNSYENEKKRRRYFKVDQIRNDLYSEYEIFEY